MRHHALAEECVGLLHAPDRTPRSLGLGELVSAGVAPCRWLGRVDGREGPLTRNLPLPLTYSAARRIGHWQAPPPSQTAPAAPAACAVAYSSRPPSCHGHTRLSDNTTGRVERKTLPSRASLVVKPRPAPSRSCPRMIGRGRFEIPRPGSAAQLRLRRTSSSSPSGENGSVAWPAGSVIISAQQYEFHRRSLICLDNSYSRWRIRTGSREHQPSRLPREMGDSPANNLQAPTSTSIRLPGPADYKTYGYHNLRARSIYGSTGLQ